MSPHKRCRKHHELTICRLVFVHDPTDSDPYVIPIGKQTLNPSHIFYRPCSGIWQSVWIESAPTDHITALNVNGDASGQVNMTVTSSSNASSNVEITVKERANSGNGGHSGPPGYGGYSDDGSQWGHGGHWGHGGGGNGGNVVAKHTGKTGSPITFKVNSAKTWSPDEPNLYDIEIKLGSDDVTSYTGFRTVGREEINGVQRITLNGDAIFTMGTLDQGKQSHISR